jgi:hypothetical protein
MTIGSVSSTNALLKQLEANGLSVAKAKLVETDVTAAAAATPVAAKGTTDAANVRAALDARIDSDVASGKLSKSDAAAVKKTLDEIDGQSSGTGSADQAAPATAQSPAQGGGPSSGGGGGGGGGTATEVSETVTVSGSTKTTVTTYSDGSTTTATATATDADKAKYEKTKTDANSGEAANDYLSTIEPGALVDQAA